MDQSGGFTFGRTVTVLLVLGILSSIGSEEITAELVAVLAAPPIVVPSGNFTVTFNIPVDPDGKGFAK